MDRSRFRITDSRFALALALPFTVGAILCAYRIGGQSLWLDESYTWWFARLAWVDLLHAARIDAVNPPLYYVFVKLFAPSAAEAALRFPSALAHIAGIAGAGYLGYWLGGRPGAFAAALLWAVHPMTLWAARDARPYALSAALAVWAVALFHRLQRAWSRPLALLTGIVVACGLLTHYFSFVLLASLLVLAGLDIRRSPTFFRRWTIVALLAMIPLAVWLAWFFSTGSPSLGIGWIRRPIPADVVGTLWNLLSGYAGVIDLASAALGVAMLVIIAYGLAVETRAGLRLVLAGLLVPVAGVWVISQTRPVFVDRYFIVILPFVAGLAAIGAAALARRTLGAIRRWIVPLALAACILAAMAGVTVHTASKFFKEDWRGLAAFLHGRGAQQDDIVLSEPEIALPLTYYFAGDFLNESPRLVPDCGEACWWILRQPYTATHAFTQSVSEAGRESARSLPAGCTREDSWISPTGIAVWKVACPAAD